MWPFRLLDAQSHPASAPGGWETGDGGAFASGEGPQPCSIAPLGPVAVPGWAMTLDRGRRGERPTVAGEGGRRPRATRQKQCRASGKQEGGRGITGIGLTVQRNPRTSPPQPRPHPAVVNFPGAEPASSATETSFAPRALGLVQALCLTSRPTRALPGPSGAPRSLKGSPPSTRTVAGRSRPGGGNRVKGRRARPRRPQVSNGRTPEDRAGARRDVGFRVGLWVGGSIRVPDRGEGRLSV